METRLKPAELKCAPAWKRALSYLIDSTFLIFFLILLVMTAYGDDFSALYSMVKQTGGLDLILKEGLFTNQIDLIRSYPKEVQDILYMQNFIANRYFYLIYVYFHILTVGYYTFFWRMTGQTLGARILNIRVISQKAAPLSVGTCLLRSILLRLYEYAYYIPALMVLDPRLNQRLHDKLTSTVVIENKEWEETMANLQKMMEEEAEKMQHP